jgi:hypothetical protein
VAPLDIGPQPWKFYQLSSLSSCLLTSSKRTCDSPCVRRDRSAREKSCPNLPVHVTCQVSATFTHEARPHSKFKFFVTSVPLSLMLVVFNKQVDVKGVPLAHPYKAGRNDFIFSCTWLCRYNHLPQIGGKLRLDGRIETYRKTRESVGKDAAEGEIACHP